MKHLIIGYGYTAYYLARELLAQGHQVCAVSRHKPQEHLAGLEHQIIDLNNKAVYCEIPCIIYYCAPPPADGFKDSTLSNFLHLQKLNIKHVTYLSSSGVYGNHNGAWVDENSVCLLDSARSKRRYDAEQQWLHFGAQNNVPVNILRVAGIYGPGRLPLDGLNHQTPLIYPDQAPLTNHICVIDLVNIMLAINKHSSTKILNVADGEPLPMGSLLKTLAEILAYPVPPYTSFAKAYQQASPMKKEFMIASKKLNIHKLIDYLPADFKCHNLREGIKLSLIAQNYSQNS